MKILIINFTTFCVVKTKLKNIYQFGRYSCFCKSAPFVERKLHSLNSNSGKCVFLGAPKKSKLMKKSYFVLFFMQCLGMPGIFLVKRLSEQSKNLSKKPENAMQAKDLTKKAVFKQLKFDFVFFYLKNQNFYNRFCQIILCEWEEICFGKIS